MFRIDFIGWKKKCSSHFHLKSDGCRNKLTVAMKLTGFVTIYAYFLICRSFKNKIFVHFYLGLSATVQRAFIFTPCPGFGFRSVLFH